MVLGPRFGACIFSGTARSGIFASARSHRAAGAKPEQRSCDARADAFRNCNYTPAAGHCAEVDAQTRSAYRAHAHTRSYRNAHVRAADTGSADTSAANAEARGAYSSPGYARAAHAASADAAPDRNARCTGAGRRE